MEKKKVVAVLHASGYYEGYNSDLGYLSYHQPYLFPLAYVLYEDDTVDVLTHGDTSLKRTENNFSIRYPYTLRQAKILLQAIRDGVPSNR